MAKGLVKKIGNICEKIEKFSREMESIKKLNGNSSTEKVWYQNWGIHWIYSKEDWIQKNRLESLKAG